MAAIIPNRPAQIMPDDILTVIQEGDETSLALKVGDGKEWQKEVAGQQKQRDWWSSGIDVRETVAVTSYEKCWKIAYFFEWLVGNKKSVEVAGKRYVVSSDALESWLRNVKGIGYKPK